MADNELTRKGVFALINGTETDTLGEMTKAKALYCAIVAAEKTSTQKQLYEVKLSEIGGPNAGPICMSEELKGLKTALFADDAVIALFEQEKIGREKLSGRISSLLERYKFVVRPCTAA